MEERTIGGKPIKTVMSELKADIAGIIRWTDDKKQPYIEIGILKDYFNQVIPVENYDFICGPVQMVQIGKKACFHTYGSIVLKDDHGSPICKKSASGSYDIRFAIAGGEAIGLAMDQRNATNVCMKNCMTMFGCGMRQLEKAKLGKKDKGKKTQPSQSAAQTAYRPDQKVPYGDGKFSCRVSLDKENIVDTPSMILVPVCLTEYDEYRTHVLFWKNNLEKEKIEEEWLRNQMVNRTVFMCEGKLEPYGNYERIVFKHFLRGIS